MKLVAFRQALIAVLFATSCVTGWSCRRHEMPSQADVDKNTKPAAEESFDFIMDTFRRRMEETPLGFVVKDPSGHSTLTGRNKVTAELIRPTNPTDPYRAVITVTRESRYWVTRTREGSPDDNRERDSKKNDLAKSGDETRVDSFDGGQAEKEAEVVNTAPRQKDDFNASRPDEKVGKYELLYQDGRWVLTTKLNEETEQSIQNAFNSALAVQ